MKRRDLERHLREYGCMFDHHGGNHDVWLNTLNGLETAFPRHREIKATMVRAICRQLEVPPPRKVS